MATKKAQKPGYEGTFTILDLRIELTPAQAARAADPNPCVRSLGAGPSGAKCKTCTHLIVKYSCGSKFFKCALRGDTNGAGTDHRQKWNACARYQEGGK